MLRALFYVVSTLAAVALVIALIPFRPWLDSAESTEPLDLGVDDPGVDIDL